MKNWKYTHSNQWHTASSVGNIHILQIVFKSIPRIISSLWQMLGWRRKVLPNSNTLSSRLSYLSVHRKICKDRCHGQRKKLQTSEKGHENILRKTCL